MRRGWTIHHNGPPANCIGRSHQRCLDFWAAVKAFHTNPEPRGKGWSDIAYSFGVCPHGERLVGRGWNKSQWANGSDQVGAEDGDDDEWYTVLVFVGGDTSTNDAEEPTREMVVATAALIEEGRRDSRCGFAVRPHNDWKRKPCPGPHFTPLARAWDGVDITIEPPEDDMTPDDRKWLEVKLDELRAEVRADTASVAAGAAKQTVKKILLGGESSIFDPNGDKNEWMLTSPTLTGVLAELRGQPAPVVDVDALAEALAGKLDGIEVDEVKAAVREVFADAGSPG